MEKTSPFREHINEVRAEMGLQDGESLLAAIRAMKLNLDDARADLAASEKHVLRLNAELDRLEKRLTAAGCAKCDRLAAQVAAVREQLMRDAEQVRYWRGNAARMYEMHEDELNQYDSFAAMLEDAVKALDSPVSTVRVTAFTVLPDLWAEAEKMGVEHGDTLLLVRVPK